jgi:hypothetical protein
MGPYVNVTAYPPFGIILAPGHYDSLARAKAKRPPGARTVRYRQALALLAESAMDEQRWDAIREYDRTRSEALSENAFLRLHTASQTMPVSAVADLPRATWALLEKSRLALAGLGHVRPRELPGNHYSTTEVEVTMTRHEVAVLEGIVKHSMRSPRLTPPPIERGELSHPATDRFVSVAVAKVKS